MPKRKTGKYYPCDLCSIPVWIIPARDLWERHFCSREHLLSFKKENAFRFPCVVCEKIIFCQPCQIYYRNRKTCSDKCRDVLKLRRIEAERKSNPPSVGVLNRRIRYSKKMQLWRKAVFDRDDYTCQICGIRGTYLEADHIKRFAEYPELRFEISNGRTLCRPCHMKTDSWGNRGKHAKKETEKKEDKAA